jgi:hypothetical protein
MVISRHRSVTTTNAVVADARRVFDNMTATTTGAVVAAVPKYCDSDARFVIYAPAGTLGVVVDTPDEGAPVVHAIKENSVLIDQVKVGDRLIGVDEIDVRSFTVTQVCKLMNQRCTNPLRKLTLTRVDDDDEDTVDGGETASQVSATTTGAVVVSMTKYCDSDVRFVIYAPAGTLGLVVDTPDECGPVVYIVKENSVLIDQVKVGDRLIGVDDIDVRSFTAIKVSKLMSQRSTNPVRKLTFTRGTIDVDDDETAYGGETAIQVKSTTQVDTDTQGESHGMASRMWRAGSMSHLCGAEENGTSSVVDAMKVHPQLPPFLRILLFTITLLLILMISYCNIYRK